MKKKSWITKKQIEKALIEMKWNPYNTSYFNILQDLKDREYYLKTVGTMMREILEYPSNTTPVAIQKAIRLLIMAYILDQVNSETIIKTDEATKTQA